MNTLSYKTVSANKATVTKEWVLVDATDQVLGRLSAGIAHLLRGKHKTNYTPHVDCGDNVIVINASKVKIIGNKLTDKKLIHHTGYPGGQRSTNPAKILASKNPERLIEHSVKGMLPHNRLGRQIFKNLYVYAGDKHKQEAQQPKVIDLKSLK